MKPYVTPPFAGTFHHGQDDRLNAIADRMNVLVDKFMQSDATHAFFNDGDVEIPPNTIDTLIRHNVDLASGVYPFKNFKDSHAMCFGRMDKNNPCGNMRPRIWEHLKGKIVGSKEEPWTGGTGCLLVRRRVFDRHHPKIKPIRFTRDNDCGLDMLFWKRAQDAGFSARIDANIVCSHLPDLRLSKIDEWLV